MYKITIVNYKQDARILLENTLNSEYFYIVKVGKILVKASFHAAGTRAQYYTAGLSFGLVSALTNTPLNYTLVASTDCELYRIPIKALPEFLKSHRDLFMKFIGQYSSRLKAANSIITEAVAHDRLIGNSKKLLQNAKVYLDIEQPQLAAYALNAFLSWGADQPDLSESLLEARDLLKSIAYPEINKQVEGSTITLDKEEVIYCENEPSDYIYIIKSGQVKVSKLARDQEFILAVLEKNEIFGEMSALEQSVRNATVVANEEVELVRIRPENLLEEAGEVLLYKIITSFARRIWNTEKRAMITQLSNPNAKLYAYLLILLSDIDAQSYRRPGEDYIINVSLEDLKKMVGLTGVSSSTISEFISDRNMHISEYVITIKKKQEIEKKVAAYRARDVREAKLRS